jgi:hypothetical protein
MTIKSSGSLSLQEIDTEFALGTNLYAYRGIKWFKEDNTRGYFDQAMGNNPPIDMLEFYSKKASRYVLPTIPVGQVTNYTSAGTYFFPVNFFYNTLSIEVRGGDGTGGSDGKTQYECHWDGTWNPDGTPHLACGNVWYNGVDGTSGTASSVTNWISGAGGAGGKGATGSGGYGKTSGQPGTYNSITINAETNLSAPLKGTNLVCNVGSGSGAYVKITVIS